MQFFIVHRIERGISLAGKFCRVTFAAVLLASQPQTLFAADWLEYLRNYNLNDYALGIATTVSESPYIDTSESVFAYPYLTSFRSHMLTDDWLILADGDIGFRQVRESGWIFGAVGRLNTLGFGADKSIALAGMEDRQWTIEIAPSLGYRGWPVQLQLHPYWEATGRHSGFNSEFLVSLPIQHSRGWITPQIRLSYKDENYTGYYFGVTEAEALPNRPEYSPGAATDIAARLHWGYQISEKWLLSGHLDYEWLDSEISDIPIVDKDTLWSVNVGIAYNADIFRSRDAGDSVNTKPGFEIHLGLLRDSIDTEVSRDQIDGTPGDPVDLEDILGLSDDSTIGQIDAVWRINRFHRLNFGYFDLTRKATATLLQDTEVGDEIFLAGSEVNAKAETRIAHMSYSYLLMSDSQKELGLMGGVHYSRFKAEIESEATGQRVQTSASTPLPVIGVHGSISLGPRTSLGLRLQFFRMEVDHYEGRLDHAHLSLQHTFLSRISAGLGYQLYDMKLDSKHNDLNGSIGVRHHGPFVFLGMHFF
jgi:outer membrane scaffolding protein for murein synthesis (MipA/OmpV family)